MTILVTEKRNWSFIIIIDKIQIINKSKRGIIYNDNIGYNY